ncbi:MAG TPA: phosphatase PAP2 family protein [Gemmatimonadales bacterium]|nr:phosphatase PAP2 family protein [Gemmatimonadales bacterium]
MGLTLCVLGLAATRLDAQGPQPGPAAIQWWQGAAVMGGIALISAFDESVQIDIQQQRSHASNQVASVARRMGQPEVFVTVPGAMFLAGVVTHRPGLRRAGERVAGSLVLAGVLAVGGKLVVGRLRPYQAAEQYDFKPFSGDASFPSGHATMAFALATALADEIRQPWATVGLMTAATGTAWSRLNDNDHWLSDVAAGAVVGITSAQFIEGRWTVFHVRPPAVFSAQGERGLVWRVPIRLP